MDYITATRRSGDVIHPQLGPLGLGPRLIMCVRASAIRPTNEVVEVRSLDYGGHHIDIPLNVFNLGSPRADPARGS